MLPAILESGLDIARFVIYARSCVPMICFPDLCYEIKIRLNPRNRCSIESDCLHVSPAIDSLTNAIWGCLANFVRGELSVGRFRSSSRMQGEPGVWISTELGSDFLELGPHSPVMMKSAVRLSLTSDHQMAMKVLNPEKVWLNSLSCLRLMIGLLVRISKSEVQTG